MKKVIKINVLLSAIVIATAFFTSCKKETISPMDIDNANPALMSNEKISWYTPVTVSNSGTTVPVIRGIHVGTDWYGPLDSAVYKNKDVTSISLYCFWRYLNPSYNVYDWTRLDSELSNYTANGKNVGLVVAAGCRSPDWIYTHGVRHFTITEHNGGSGSVFTREQAVVFDSAYISLFTQFITALSAHMQTQSYWNKLTHVAINGINRTTAEFRLPSEQGANGSTNSVALWNSVGYTQTKVINAFKAIAQVVASSFPNRLLDVPYIQDQTSAFPAIGTGDIGGTCFTWLKQQYPTRVLARYTAVAEGYIPHGFSVTLTGQGIPLGGELSQSKYETTTNKAGLKLAIQAGIDANMMYVELYPDNVTRYPTVMAAYSPLVYKQ